MPGACAYVYVYMQVFTCVGVECGMCMMCAAYVCLYV